jgi:hypothetical protein
MRRLALIVPLAFAPLADVAAQTGCPSASVIAVNGGGGSQWFFCNQLGTTNGLPAGGSVTAGNGASIAEALLGNQGDAFDDGGNVWVDNVIVGGPLQTTPASFGTIVGIGPRQLSGIEADVDYDVLNSQSTVRVLAILRNQGTSSRSVNVTYTTNFGSDTSSFVRATSSGDLSVTTADRWLVSSDSADGDPVNTTAFWGGTPPVTPNLVNTTVYSNFGTEGLLAQFPVTVPAGTDVILMFFQRLSPTTPQAIAAATDFNNIGTSSPLLAGLSAQELGMIKNWTFGPGGSSAPNVVLDVAPTRITQSQNVALSWTPTNVTQCTPGGGQPGTQFTSTGANSASAFVNVGAAPRNDVFSVTCTGAQGTVIGRATLAVGVPPPPPPIDTAGVNAGLGGAPANGTSSAPVVTDGGRYVVFESAASNLVSGDTNNSFDVFVRDTDTGALTRVSTSTGGGQQSNVSGEATVTRDGKFVTFTRGTGSVPLSGSSKIAITGGQVCTKDTSTDSLSCVSNSPGGAPGNGGSGNASVSGDGNIILYESLATNIAPGGDGNGAISDVFAFNKATGTNQVLSLTPGGGFGAAESNKPRISCNAGFYVFESKSNLAQGPVQSNVRNLYQATFPNGAKRLVTVGLNNAAANGDSRNARISNDGRFVFFESDASNLVSGDTNAVSDVFVADLSGASVAIRRLSTSTAGVQGNGASRRPFIPCDGAFMTFESEANNLVVGDSNGQADVFLLNMGSGALTIASLAPGATLSNGKSGNAALSPDGSTIGFDSEAGNLGGGSSSAKAVLAGINPFADQNYSGAWFDPNQSGHGLFLDQLTDGRLVAWWFTFDPNGAQAWFGGVGTINGNQGIVSVVRTEGARFLPNFVAAQANDRPLGTLTFNFTGCSTGRVDFALDSEFNTGFMNLTRLSAPIGVKCRPGGAASSLRLISAPGDWKTAAGEKLGGGPKAAVIEPTVGPIAGMTGAWFDPAQDGHGLFMENLGGGRLLAWWFTFGPNGGQAWFGGVGTITARNRATIEFVKTAGGRWIPNFNPANVTNPVLGTVEVVMNSCGGGVANYNFGQGFGSGQMILTPLVRSAGTACIE